MLYYYIVAANKYDPSTTGQSPDSEHFVKYSVSAGNKVIADGFIEQRIGRKIWYSKCVSLPPGQAEELTFSVTGFEVNVAIDDITLNAGSCDGKN